jgi:hypothetical protein
MILKSSVLIQFPFKIALILFALGVPNGSYVLPKIKLMFSIVAPIIPIPLILLIPFQLSRPITLKTSESGSIKNCHSNPIFPEFLIFVC